MSETARVFEVPDAEFANSAATVVVVRFWCGAGAVPFGVLSGLGLVVAVGFLGGRFGVGKERVVTPVGPEFLLGASEGATAHHEADFAFLRAFMGVGHLQGGFPNVRPAVFGIVDICPVVFAYGGYTPQDMRGTKRSSAHTRGEPYVPPDSAQITRISSTRAALGQLRRTPLGPFLVGLIRRRRRACHRTAEPHREPFGPLRIDEAIAASQLRPSLPRRPQFVFSSSRSRPQPGGLPLEFMGPFPSIGRESFPLTPVDLAQPHPVTRGPVVDAQFVGALSYRFARGAIDLYRILV